MFPFAILALWTCNPEWDWEREPSWPQPAHMFSDATMSALGAPITDTSACRGPSTSLEDSLSGAWQCPCQHGLCLHFNDSDVNGLYCNADAEIDLQGEGEELCALPEFKALRGRPCKDIVADAAAACSDHDFQMGKCSRGQLFMSCFLCDVFCGEGFLDSEEEECHQLENWNEAPVSRTTAKDGQWHLLYYFGFTPCLRRDIDLSDSPLNGADGLLDKWWRRVRVPVHVSAAVPPGMVRLLAPCFDLATAISHAILLLMQTALVAFARKVSKTTCDADDEASGRSGFVVTTLRLCWFTFALVYLYVGVWANWDRGCARDLNQITYYLLSMLHTSPLLRPALLGFFDTWCDAVLHRQVEHSLKSFFKKLRQDLQVFIWFCLGGPVYIFIGVVLSVQFLTGVPIQAIAFPITLVHGLIVGLILGGPTACMAKAFECSAAADSCQTKKEEGQITPLRVPPKMLPVPTLALLTIVASTQCLYFPCSTCTWQDTWVDVFTSFFKGLDWNFSFGSSYQVPGFPTMYFEPMALDLSWADLQSVHDWSWLVLLVLPWCEILGQAVTSTRNPTSDEEESGFLA
mmetsp:Transcript_37878/g.69039  ORF Transcript_37878/g.69039 Transcript_37878/m.69039 type:complete len:574 (+) Transcript_37878:53-1774(+)